MSNSAISSSLSFTPYSGGRRTTPPGGPQPLPSPLKRTGQGPIMRYNSDSTSSPRPAKGIFHSFSIVQHNSLGSWDVFLSLMNSFSQLPSPPMIVALQDPPVRRGQLPSFSTYKCFHPPAANPEWPSMSTPTC